MSNNLTAFLSLPKTCQTIARNLVFANEEKLPTTLAKNPPYKGGRGLFSNDGLCPYPVANNCPEYLAIHFRIVPLPISPSRYPTKQMTNSCSSEADIIQTADPALIRWPTNTTAILKRAVSQGSERFWAKRGMAEPKERFVPTQFPKGREGAQ